MVWKNSDPEAVFGRFFFSVKISFACLVSLDSSNFIKKKGFSASTLLSSQEYDTLLYNRRICYWCTKIANKFLYCFLFFITFTIVRQLQLSLLILCLGNYRSFLVLKKKQKKKTYHHRRLSQGRRDITMETAIKKKIKDLLPKIEVKN